MLPGKMTPGAKSMPCGKSSPSFSSSVLPDPATIPHLSRTSNTMPEILGTSPSLGLSVTSPSVGLCSLALVERKSSWINLISFRLQAATGDHAPHFRVSQLHDRKKWGDFWFHDFAIELFVHGPSLPCFFVYEFLNHKSKKNVLRIFLLHHFELAYNFNF
jgi:hypothetical protein